MKNKDAEFAFLSKSSNSGLLSRKIAWDVLLSVAAGAYADIALERALDRKDLEHIDRGLIKEISFGAIKYRYFLDCWIDCLGKLPAEKQPPPLRWLLHLGLYQIFKMDKIPVSAAVNTSVELLKGSKFARLVPVVNGILRSAVRRKNSGEKLPIPSSFSKQLAQEESLPFWLTDKLLEWCEKRKAEKIAKAFNRIPTIDIRVNRLITNAHTVEKSFAENGLNANAIEGYPNALEIASRSGDIRLWPGYFQGHWSVQDRVAQWVVPLLDPKPFEKILDACAAPGGKTTQIAEAIDDKGEVWAIDRSASRLKRVTANAQRLGIACIQTLNEDASILAEKRPAWIRSFQKILVDAPCSGLGTLSRNPDARWRITPEKIEELVLLQAHLLDGLLPLLSEGGRLVYATCTINPDENYAQIERLLQSNSDITLVEQEQRYPGINNNGDGFYAAILQREF